MLLREFMSEQFKPSLRLDLFIVLSFTLLTTLPFLGQAWNIDEPFFLAVGHHILTDPLHPFDFYFNWYGKEQLYASMNNTPPFFHYLLAIALKITGGGEWAMRALFLPFDLLSAFSLYLIAARFLKRPLLPTLIILASPAYLIDMPHLMPEKIMAAFSFLCLYSLIRSIDDNESRWYWISALALAFALLSKYAAVFLLLPAIGYSIERGVSFKRIGIYLLISLSGIALYLLYDRLTHRAALSAITDVFSALFFFKSPALTPSYKLRAFLSFVGGLGVVTCFWPPVAFRIKFKPLLIIFLATTALFLPYFDPLGPTWTMTYIRPLDRILGFIFSLGALWSIGGLFSSRHLRGWPLWTSWILSAGFIQIVLYWSIVARLIIFLLPPLIFGMAEKMESTMTIQKIKPLMIFSLIFTLFISISLARVDMAYANSQRRFAQWVKTHYTDQGEKFWFAGHWGFQYYLEKIGAVALNENDPNQKIKPGNIILYSKVNTNPVMPAMPDPKRERFDLLETITVQSPIPLRLMKPAKSLARAGFYSSLWGFLPYTFSREPLDEFFIVRAQ